MSNLSDNVCALAFVFEEDTTRLESQAFRQPRGGPIEADLILWHFLIKEKGHEVKGLVKDCSVGDCGSESPALRAPP